MARAVEATPGHLSRASPAGQHGQLACPGRNRAAPPYNGELDLTERTRTRSAKADRSQTPGPTNALLAHG